MQSRSTCPPLNPPAMIQIRLSLVDHIPAVTLTGSTSTITRQPEVLSPAVSSSNGPRTHGPITTTHPTDPISIPPSDHMPASVDPRLHRKHHGRTSTSPTLPSRIPGHVATPHSSTLDFIPDSPTEAQKRAIQSISGSLPTMCLMSSSTTFKSASSNSVKNTTRLVEVETLK